MRLNVAGIDSESGNRLIWLKDIDIKSNEEHLFKVIDSNAFSTPLDIENKFSSAEMSRKKLDAFYKLKEELKIEGLIE